MASIPFLRSVALGLHLLKSVRPTDWQAGNQRGPTTSGLLIRRFTVQVRAGALGL
jgi:hypothetical protein